MHAKKSAWVFGLVSLIFINALLWMVYLEMEDRGEAMLTVAFLDVGQGDSIYIEAPNGHQLLIDGGPDRGVLRELGSVMPFWDRSLDVVIGTHPDKDHIGGLISVVKNYRIGTYIDSGFVSDTETYEIIEEYVSAKPKTKQLVAQSRMRIDLDKEKGVYAEVLWPKGNAQEIEERNDASVTIRLVYGETEVLLTGDAGIAIERELMKNYDEEKLEADILKLGHHGSKTSSDARFLDLVGPEIAIISAGKDNRYGHPHESVISRLEERAIPY